MNEIVKDFGQSLITTVIGIAIITFLLKVLSLVSV